MKNAVADGADAAFTCGPCPCPTLAAQMPRGCLAHILLGSGIPRIAPAMYHHCPSLCAAYSHRPHGVQSPQPQCRSLPCSPKALGLPLPHGRCTPTAPMELLPSDAPLTAPVPVPLVP